MKKTLVLGATPNPIRYAYVAVQRLLRRGHQVIAVGNKKGYVLGIEIQDIIPHSIPDLDTITLYINPQVQKYYYHSILNLKPKRVIFNPGTENPELEKLCREAGIEVLEACTLVMLSTDQY